MAASALPARSTSATAACPRIATKCRGVICKESCAHGSALARSKISAAAAWPLKAADGSGPVPRVLTEMALPPKDNIFSKTWGCPFVAANKVASEPSASRAFSGAPCSRSHATAGTCPLCAAMCSALRPAWSGLNFELYPFRSSKMAMWPPLAAAITAGDASARKVRSASSSIKRRTISAWPVRAASHTIGGVGYSVVSTFAAFPSAMACMFAVHSRVPPSQPTPSVRLSKFQVACHQFSGK
mmetsp:Transcript_123655/g.395596  ORF Transcript_123655/g.395596 Transcript_123655/m.395596 type:complete len:242 (-) Transcript_123655:966-1691(-)